MANLIGAPIVIKSRKTSAISFDSGGGRSKISDRDTITLDMKKQGLSDIEFLLKAITIEETKAQVKKGNDPSSLVVDNRQNKPLHTAKRRVEVTFGNFLDQLMIKAVERTLMNEIRKAVKDDSAKLLGSIGNWEWLYAEKSKGKAAPVNPRTMTAIAIGSLLILKPKSNQAGIQDMFAARRDAGWEDADLWKKGRSGGMGFMAKSINKLKRTRLMKNYSIYVVFTQRFKLSNEIYSHGTPVIVIRVRRRSRGYKRYGV